MEQTYRVSLNREGKLNLSRATGEQSQVSFQWGVPGKREQNAQKLYKVQGASLKLTSDCCFSVAKLYPTLCDPIDCSMPVFPVPHHLLEFAQVHVHWISGAIQSILGNQPSVLIGMTDVKAEASILWPPDVKSQLIGRDSDAGKDWRQKEKRVTENEMVGWHHKWQWSFILDISGVSPWALEKSIYWLLGEKDGYPLHFKIPSKLPSIG